MFSMVALKFINWLLGLLPSFDFNGVPSVNVVSDVLNIFAWINYLLPMDVIVSLLGINTAYYSFKLVWSILMRTKDIIL